MNDYRGTLGIIGAIVNSTCCWQELGNFAALWRGACRRGCPSANADLLAGFDVIRVFDDWLASRRPDGIDDLVIDDINVERITVSCHGVGRIGA
jgi:hypothetical protein